jgi:hypothetical protein
LLAIALCTNLVSGCSLLFMTPAPNPAPRETFPQCSDGVSPIMIDSVGAIGLGLLTWSEVTGNTKGLQTVATGALAALLAGSAVYGTVVASRCKTARAAAEKLILPPPPGEPSGLRATLFRPVSATGD